MNKTIIDINGVVNLFNGHISKWTVYELVKRGEIPHVRLGNKKILFTEENVLAWFENYMSVVKPTIAK